MDRRRSILALASGALAWFAAVLASIDLTMSFTSIVVPILASGAVAALILALYPSGPSWTRRRRVIAVVVGIAWTVGSLATFVFAIAVAACACGGGPGYVAPAPLGIQTRIWLLIAYTGCPILLLIAGGLRPRRPRPV